VKKLFSSVCLALILLNVMGYYGVLIGLEYKSRQNIINQFDIGIYNRSHALSLKIPLAAYAVESKSFHDDNGDFIQNGQLYRLIKQRVYQDTFHVIYLKDIRGTAINLALKDYAQSFGSQPEDEGGDSYVLPLFMKEYWVRSFSLRNANSGWTLPVLLSTRARSFISVFSPSIIHPPERMS
jgi:hypothetical protein